MMVVFWDAVHPYFGASNPEVNSASFIHIVFLSLPMNFVAGELFPSHLDNRWDLLIYHIYL